MYKLISSLKDNNKSKATKINKKLSKKNLISLYATIWK